MGKIMLIVIIFLIIGGFIIAKSYDLNLKETEDRRTFLGKFSIWLVGIGKNIAKTVGFAVKQDWLPETEKNETHSVFEILDE